MILKETCDHAPVSENMFPTPSPQRVKRCGGMRDFALHIFILHLVSRHFIQCNIQLRKQCEAGSRAVRGERASRRGPAVESLCRKQDLYRVHIYSTLNAELNTTLDIKGRCIH